MTWCFLFCLRIADSDGSNFTTSKNQKQVEDKLKTGRSYNIKMLDLNKLLKTQYDEFVALLKDPPLLASMPLLKTKFGYLRAIVEHERLVSSVTTVCNRRNTIANKAFDDRKQDDCKHKMDCNQNDKECKQDDRKPDSCCSRDDMVGNECRRDVSKPEMICNRDVTTMNVSCKRDDRKPELNESNLKTIGTKEENEACCGQDDCKLETNCADTLDDECKQDDCKPLMDCSQDDTGTELKKGDLTEIFKKNNEELLNLLRSQFRTHP